MTLEPDRYSIEELSAEGGTLLPAKEVLSLLDLNVNIDLALDLVAPIDLAVAGNLNVAAPINGGVSANVLSALSSAAAQSEHGVMLDQVISGEAVAHAPQTAVVDQSDDTVGDAPAPVASATPAAVDPVDPAVELPTLPDVGGTTGALLDGDLLNVNVDVAVDADLAAPVAGAVALNANVAAPINASVAANVGAIGSEAIAVTNQQAIITQHLDDVTADALANQDADITQ